MCRRSPVPLPGLWDQPPHGLRLSGFTAVQNPEIRVMAINRKIQTCVSALREPTARTRACCLSRLNEEVVLPGEAVYTKHKAIEADANFFSLRSDCFYLTVPETLRRGSTWEHSHVPPNR